MGEAWSVEVWGVRGSAPKAHRDFLRYGGNTSCIFAKCGQEAVIFDAGSGLLGLGKVLAQEGVKKVHILLSHLHMDHICGLFGFSLFLDPVAEVHLYGNIEGGIGFRERLKGLLGSPYWPLGLADFSACVKIHEVMPGTSFYLAGIKEDRRLTVHTLEGNHPGGSLLYRVEGEEKSIIYGLDCELNDAMFQALREFSREGSLLIWDANFADEDLERCKGWGHSSWRQGITLGKEAQVKMVLMTHYSGEYTDEFLQRQQELAGREDASCCFAREGMVIQL